MAFCLYLGLDHLRRADGESFHRLDRFGFDGFVVVKSILLDGDFAFDNFRLVVEAFDLVHIDGRFVDAAKGFVDILEFVFLGIKKCVVANEM